MLDQTSPHFDLLQQWYKAKDALAAAKQAEATLREQVREAIFHDAPEEGTSNVPLPDGYTLKHAGKVNRKLDHAAFLEARERLSELGVNTDKLVEYSPKFNLGYYRKLSDVQKLEVDYLITATPGAPTLTVAAPKAK